MLYGPTYDGGGGYDRKRPAQEVSGGSGETWGTTFGSDRQRDMLMTVVARGWASGAPDQAVIQISTRDPDAVFQAVYCDSPSGFVLPKANEQGITVLKLNVSALAVSETLARIGRKPGDVQPLVDITWKHSLDTSIRLMGAAGACAISIARDIAQNQAQQLRHVFEGMVEARPAKLDAASEGKYDAATNTIVYTVDMVVTFRARQSSVTFGGARGDVFPAM